MPLSNIDISESGKIGKVLPEDYYKYCEEKKHPIKTWDDIALETWEKIKGLNLSDQNEFILRVLDYLKGQRIEETGKANLEIESAKFHISEIEKANEHLEGYLKVKVEKEHGE